MSIYDDVIADRMSARRGLIARLAHRFRNAVEQDHVGIY
jgi:hypothetical protein